MVASDKFDHETAEQGTNTDSTPCFLDDDYDALFMQRVGQNYAYDERSVLGEGTFGTVYRGFDVHSQQAVAVKKIAAHRVRTDELTIMQHVDSDFVVRLVHLEVCPKFTFVVMELCDADLRSHLQTVQALDFADTAVVAHDLACGYYALFEKDIIHRDIKSHNILVQLTSRPLEKQQRIRNAKLSDFSTSRIVNEPKQRKFSALAGSPLYMAPEVGANILDSTKYDEQVDMWSCGVVLYECTFGKTPFDEANLCKLFLMAANKNYAAYRAPELPENAGVALQHLVRDLLNIDATARLTPQQFFAYVRHHFVQSPIVEKTRSSHADVDTDSYCLAHHTVPVLLTQTDFRQHSTDALSYGNIPASATLTSELSDTTTCVLKLSGILAACNFCSLQEREHTTARHEL